MRRSISSRHASSTSGSAGQSNDSIRHSASSARSASDKPDACFLSFVSMSDMESSIRPAGSDYTSRSWTSFADQPLQPVLHRLYRLLDRVDGLVDRFQG